MSTPYITKNPGDLVLSNDWNDMQIQQRQALQNHNHDGTGDNANPINTVGIADNAITTPKIGDGAVTDAKIVGLSASKLTGQITSAQIADGALASVDIADNAVTTTKILDGTVTDAKIQSMNSDKLSGSIEVSGANVGLGTTSPTAKLQIECATGNSAPVNNGVYVYNTHANNHAILAARVHDVNAGNPFVSFDVNSVKGWSLGIDNADSQKFKIAGNWGDLQTDTRLTIDASNGNVGIGTATPTEKLEVSGNAKFTGTVYISSSNVDGGGLKLADDGDIVDLNDGYATHRFAKGLRITDAKDSNTVVTQLGNKSAEPTYFNAGNVGIGTTAPAAKLHVISTAIVGRFESTENQCYLQFLTNEGVDNRVEFANRAGGNAAIWVGGAGDALTVSKNGNVGLGTTNPTKAKLQVEGSASYNAGQYRWLNHGGEGFPGDQNNSYSIYASNHIAAIEFNAYSDARIKDISSVSNSDQDLATLEQIEVVDYTYKDKIAKGDKAHKKVIGQQVAEVFPQVVNTVNDEIVPDIMQKASMVKGLVQLAGHDVAVDDEIQIITLEGKKETHKVTGVTNKDSFQLDTKESAEAVFVYGRKVDDFHVVDYEGIAMLNVSATQALSAQVKALQQQNAALEARLAALEAK